MLQRGSGSPGDAAQPARATQTETDTAAHAATKAPANGTQGDCLGECHPGAPLTQQVNALLRKPLAELAELADALDAEQTPDSKVLQAIAIGQPGHLRSDPETALIVLRTHLQSDWFATLCADDQATLNAHTVLLARWQAQRTATQALLQETLQERDEAQRKLEALRMLGNQ